MIELNISILASDVDCKIEKLEEAGFYNICCEIPIEVTTIKFGYDFRERKGKTTSLKIYIDPVQSSVESSISLIKQVLGSETQVSFQEIMEDNWQQEFETIDLNNGWKVMSPSEVEKSDEEKFQNVIIFESQGAFGTGLHETTQDCLRAVLSIDLKGQSVLDLGAGSGILSIAAALKNAEYIVAVDISDVQREISYNSKLNGIRNIKVLQQDVTKEDFSFNQNFNLIMINIGGEEILKTMEFINRSLAKNGKLLVSGLVDWSFEEVKKIIIDKGFKQIDYYSTNEWITLLFQNIN